VIAIPASTLDALRREYAHQLIWCESIESGLQPRWVHPGTVGNGRWQIPDPGIPLKPDQVTRAWRKVIRVDAGIPEVRFHDLRHFVATTLLDAGLSLVQVAAILGHADPTTTARIYAHDTAEGAASAAGILDLG
jgi:integrase